MVGNVVVLVKRLGIRKIMKKGYKVSYWNEYLRLKDGWTYIRVENHTFTNEVQNIWWFKDEDQWRSPEVIGQWIVKKY